MICPKCSTFAPLKNRGPPSMPSDRTSPGREWPLVARACRTRPPEELQVSNFSYRRPFWAPERFTISQHFDK
eukprot:762951-Pyramimonas_sp.AAC.1